MDFSFTDEQELLQREIQRFCDKELTREYVRWMEHNCDFIPDELWNKIAEVGYFGIGIPQEYGGMGRGMIEVLILMEELSTASVSVALCTGATIGFGGKPVLTLGTEDQKENLLPKIARGELRFALGLTEQGGGTDILGTMQTKAEDKGDHWLINGSKVFITGAHVADYIYTVAITDPHVSRVRGLSSFLVPRPSQGLETRLIPKLGCHASGANEIFYDNVRVPKENVLGTVNNGWYELLTTLNPERICTAMMSVGLAKAAFRDAMDYAKQRYAFGKPIASFQILQHYLADIAIDIECARNLVYKCAWLSDEGKPMHIEASMAKVAASEAAEKAAIWGMEILGSWGYSTEFDMERYFRDYKLMAFAPISNEMAKNMIMQFMGLPRSW